MTFLDVIVLNLRIEFHLGTLLALCCSSGVSNRESAASFMTGKVESGHKNTIELLFTL